MSLVDFVTIVAFGQTGAGKSEFLNAYLGREAFKADNGPLCTTFRTSSAETRSDSLTRVGIDTQGIDDTQGVDAAHVEQMVQFLRDYPHGVNLFAIVINAQAPRFDAGTKKLVRILRNLGGSPDFWDHVCIVFSRCYSTVPVNKEVKRTQYRDEVLKVVRECDPAQSLNPQIPVFFVDSPLYKTDMATKSELAAIHAFAVGLPPMPTKILQKPDAQIHNTTKETQTVEINRQATPFIRTNINAQGIERQYQTGKIIQITMEEQQRDKQLHYDMKTVTHSPWVTVRCWTKTDKEGETTILKTRVEQQEKEVRRNSSPFYRTDINADGRSSSVVTGQTITITMQTLERVITTYADGRVDPGEWVVKRNYTNTEKTGDHSVSGTRAERRTVQKSTRSVPVMGERRGKRRYGFAGPRRKHAYVDHYDTYVTEAIEERTVTSYADGRSSDTGWRTVRTLPERKA